MTLWIILVVALIVLFFFDVALTWRANDLTETIIGINETIEEIEADIGTMQTKIDRIERRLREITIQAEKQAVQPYKGVPKL